MKKRKFSFLILLLTMLLFGETLSVWGAEEEWYELYEIEES